MQRAPATFAVPQGNDSSGRSGLGWPGQRQRAPDARGDGSRRPACLALPRPPPRSLMEMTLDSVLDPATSAPSPRSPVRRDTMTGLNLETFLRLLRADLGARASLGAIVLVLALMAWTSWGSRKVLAPLVCCCCRPGHRPVREHALDEDAGPAVKDPAGSSRPGIEEVRVIPHAEEAVEPLPPMGAGDAGRRGGIAPTNRLALADPEISPPRPRPARAIPSPPRSRAGPVACAGRPVRPEPAPPSAPSPETRSDEESPPGALHAPPRPGHPGRPERGRVPVVAARDAAEPATPPDEAERVASAPNSPRPEPPSRPPKPSAHGPR